MMAVMVFSMAAAYCLAAMVVTCFRAVQSAIMIMVIFCAGRRAIMVVRRIFTVLVITSHAANEGYTGSVFIRPRRSI